ncbi:MAG TPA: hypothetical protein VGA78_10985, partial [Gemmatimonadales bacterium]
SDTGGGYSAWRDLALTRWSADWAAEAQGFLLLIRSIDQGHWWRAGSSQDRSCLVTTRLEVAVAPDADIELRRLTLGNSASTAQRLELTSYVEVALNHPAADAGHPAFSKLFVQTEQVPPAILLAHRRPRGPEEAASWMGHSLWIEGDTMVPLQFETDRARFIGRGRTLADPAALDRGPRFSGTVGNVLDPILSLRCEVVIEPGETRQFVWSLAAGDSREAVLALLDRDRAAGPDPVFQRARTVILPGTAFPPPTTGGRFRAAAEAFPPRPPRRPQAEPLRFSNGWGGFTQDGSEYVLTLEWENDRLRLPPLPWANVVANEVAGFVASERGAGYTWSENSRENRLTPWSNDPVSDPHGEALYLRDEEQDVYWSPLPGPAPGPDGYEVRHGFGYSIWRHSSMGLEQEVVAFVPRHDPLKLTRLRIRNPGSKTRKLSLIAYVEWVLGGLRTDTAGSIVTRHDAETGAIFATNPERVEWAGRVAFFSVLRPREVGEAEVTTDRRSFLGPGGSVARPAAVLTDAPLDHQTGAGLDPCAAFRAGFHLAPGEQVEFTLALGEGGSEEAARRLLHRFRDAAAVTEALDGIRAFWRDVVTRVQVSTPVPAIDLMVNGWLCYQNLSCRVWARSALYQSGGAFGFRDQLQDAAALTHALPELTRSQILLHAAHQFPEGDVLHWWHPPSSKGIRTRFSDDLLWLPYVVCGYLRHTGDLGLLDEPVRFVAARELVSGEDEAYLEPQRISQSTTLYDHCCRAVDRSLTHGVHGLPLMGSGDWNDGMNRVGREGRGESVWLGFFLYRILEEFTPWCEGRGDESRVVRYRGYQASLAEALNDAGWDGEWYRRAYYDDGSPLGSASSDECRIDAIAQAWAVISRAAPADRAAKALDAADRHLVAPADGIIRLLTPPFDRTAHDPGYIKGYLPGVRENGGQYTHGALWLVRALAEAGRVDRAAQLLEMLSPVTRAATPEAVSVYRVEPYVVAADVYGETPHLGRGGWTWYTGSAGWMFRVALESILGMTVDQGKEIVLRPRIPADWPGYSIRYRLPDGETVYDLRVTQSSPRPGATAAEVDGRALMAHEGAVRIPLVRDGTLHRVTVRLGSDLTVAPGGLCPAAS